MPRLSAAFAAMLILGASAALAQTTQPPLTSGEPGAKAPATQDQANPGASRQAQPDGDEIGWGQNKPDAESKADPQRNEITGQPPASAPAK